MARTIAALCILIAALGIGAFLLRGRVVAVRTAASGGVRPGASGAFPVRPSPRPTLAPSAGPPAADLGGRAGEEHPFGSLLCASGMVLVETESQRFCIDRFEYPNLRGALPVVLVSFDEAERSCVVERKRLCTEPEWTLACNGGLEPAQGGATDGTDECNLGASTERIDPSAFQDFRKVSELVARFDQRRPSGASPGCVSNAGAYDMLGNVAEWVTSAASGGAASVLKGGDFSSPRAGCREKTVSGARYHRSFPVGFRCCSGPLSPENARAPVGSGVALPSDLPK